MRVLAIGCHPDDLEIGCAGTLAKYRQQGHTVVMCHITNGNMGHKEIKPDELKIIRRKEAENSARIIGAEIITADIDDLIVYEGLKEQRDKVVDIIRYANPDLIITHSPDDYMPDHVAVSKLVFDASFTATLNHYDTIQKTTTHITPIYYMDTLAGLNFTPTEYVDITETMDNKLLMLEKHESQIKWMKDHDNIDFLEFVTVCSRFRGLQSGVKFAEAFTQCYVYPKVTTQRLLP